MLKEDQQLYYANPAVVRADIRAVLKTSTYIAVLLSLSMFDVETHSCSSTGAKERKPTDDELYDRFMGL
jgi:hypothetical protein